MKSLICLFLIILLPLISIVEGGLLGASKPVNVMDPKVVEIAKFAILEHNKQSKGSLVYVKVLDGTEQVVSGRKYDLTISAKNGGGAVKSYKAVVVEKAWENPSKTLESFKAVL